MRRRIRHDQRLRQKPKRRSAVERATQRCHFVRPSDAHIVQYYLDEGQATKKNAHFLSVLLCLCGETFLDRVVNDAAHAFS